MRDNDTLYVLVGSVIGLWGLWGFFGKIGLDHRMTPLAMFLVEVSAGFALGLLLVAFVLQHGQPMPWKQSWNVFGVLSGVALAAGLLLYYLALERSWASIVVPVTATYPIVSVLLSVVFLGERLTWVQSLGIALVLIGLVLLLSAPVAGVR